MPEASGLKQQTWVSAAFMLILFSMGSKVLGFFREILIAKNFGISSDVDSYLVAISVPVLIGGVIGSSLGISLIPFYHKIDTAEGPDKARNLLKTTFTFTLMVSAFFMFVQYLMPERVIKTIAPNLPASTMNNAVGMLKWLSLIVVGYAVFNILYSIYNALHHFIAPALTDLLSNVFVIISLLFFASRYGIYALMGGFMAGSFVVVILLSADLTRRGLIGLRADFGSREFKDMLLFTGPVLLFAFFPQLSVIIENYFASSLKEGSIASLGYAKRLFDIVPTFLAMNIAKAIFPTVSTLSSEGRTEELRDLVVKLNKQVMLYFVPLTMIFVFFGGDMVKAVFMRGKFDEAALALTTRAFVFYAPGLVASILIPIYFRLCYGFSDNRTPLIAAGVALTIMIPFNYLLTPVLGLVGIALVDSVAIFVKISILFLSVRKKLGGIALKPLFKTLFFSILCALIAIIPFVFFRTSTIAGFLVSVALYFILYLVLGMFFLKEEIRAFWLSLNRLIKSRREAKNID